MSEEEHVFRGEGITVHHNLKRCIHTAECVRRLTRAFDTRLRPAAERGYGRR